MLQPEESIDTPQNSQVEHPAPERTSRFPIIWDILLIGILIVGAYFRLIGVNWDQGTHMHPDERFLTMVASSLSPVSGIGAYFDTNHSTLNPHNVGYGFYVYGTLPLFIVRGVAEVNKQTGYGDIQIVGRYLSAFFDLLTVWFVYLIALRLTSKQRLALLAAAFYALAVLPIQLSHFFKEDTFLTFFATLTLYFAIRILPTGNILAKNKAQYRPWADGFEYVFFGIAFGMALASKVNIAPLALVLPGAGIIRLMAEPVERRERMIAVMVGKLAVAGVFVLLTFRICQPYAFSGPGFFDIKPNQRWVDNMKEIAQQNSGDVDFPPQLQWARRPITFSLQNQVEWGLGAPLGILAWAGFLAMGWRFLRGSVEDRWCFLLLWLWTGAYFAWQSLSITRTMRYQMPSYPTLAVIAAWAVFALWEWGKRRYAWQRIAAFVIGASVLAATGAWAFAFTRIYTRTFTRVEASRWIYQNVPGPANLIIQTSGVEINQPISFAHGAFILPGQDITMAFSPRQDGLLKDLEIDHIVDVSADSGTKTAIKSLVGVVFEASNPQPIAYTLLNDSFDSDGDPRGKPFTFAFENPVKVEAGKKYKVVLNLAQEKARLQISGSFLLGLMEGKDTIHQPLPEPEESIREGEGMAMNFAPVRPGTVQRVFLNRAVDWDGINKNKRLTLKLSDLGNPADNLGSGTIEGTFLPGQDIRGEGVWVTLDRAVTFILGHTYNLEIHFDAGPGRIAIYGSKHANESTWDDALPLGVDGYDPYGYNSGVYRTDLNFEMYWDDNPDKLNRFQTTLDQADYIFISSNRQWGTTVRVPERYPLTTLYYRSLLGCPLEKDIVWCYSVAKPGMFRGDLGFELVYIEQSDPNLGPIRFNTQFAEEAFTVYDHPKVLIFKKTAAYDPARVRTLLKTVDLSMVVHLTPNKAGSYVGNLLLSADAETRQRTGGTWSALFDLDALQNSYPAVGVVLWYLAISLIGWLVYPIVRLALRGLPDHGYPLVRISGMLLLVYPVWLLGSFGVGFERGTITLIVLVLGLVGGVCALLQRRELIQELRDRWRYFLAIEGIALIFYILFLLVRLGNPDLWHQWKGGEKPMDFSYFNAVIKSTTFPPYDPWFAGGYINYYYYGFVLVGVPVKWLGIVPSIAYNLILPQLFSMLALGGFSLAWNILVAVRRDLHKEDVPAYGGGLTAATFLVVLGNLGSLRMIWHGLMRLAAPSGDWVSGNIFQRISWTFGGIVQFFSGQALPYPPGDWYWIPSRALPANSGDPITEFPAFTFLYADLHAHLIALPVTVLAFAWGLSILLGKWHWGNEEGQLKWLHLAASFFLGGLAIGTLRPTNTWDFPTYLALGIAALVFTIFRYSQPMGFFKGMPGWLQKSFLVVFSVGILGGLALLLYQPYARWYGQGYNAVTPWTDGHTNSWSYLTHWGLFLFMIVTFLFLETIDWMAKTPISALGKLRPVKGYIYLALGLLVLAIGVLTARQVWVGWMVLPLMAWAGVLLLRPGMPAGKRGVLFLVGTGLALTLLVELIVLVGDINRMNTVFKFYLQAWTLLGISAAVALSWAFTEVERVFSPGWRVTWHLAAAVLIGAAALFPLLAGSDKIRDRMAVQAPHTLDGMTYMAYAHYNENNVDMDLSEDYRAIRWMQRNIPGSPVIVEGNVPEYRWGNRYTIYTGLPGVVGWNWHQRQQRGSVTPETWVTSRVAAIGDFYTTPDPQQAVDFLKQYEVSYIIVGRMEEAIYPESGLAKFGQENGSLWDQVYHDGQTTIYKVR